MDGSTLQPDSFDRHFWLTRSVARVAGINLSSALANGRLSAEDYGEMVASCQAAGCAESCQRWLAGRPVSTGEIAPHCVHADRLHALL